MECFVTVHFLRFMLDAVYGGGLNSNSILLLPYRDALFAESALTVSYSFFFATRDSMLPLSHFAICSFLVATHENVSL